MKHLGLVPAVPGSDGEAPEPAWRLLTTLPDLPSAQSLAEVLNAAGLPARVSSDAGVLGAAAPSRIYVSAALLVRAREYLAQGGPAGEQAEAPPAEPR
jgi:hypothetical protein